MADVVKNSRIAATEEKQVQEEAASGIKKVKAGSVPRYVNNVILVDPSPCRVEKKSFF